MPAASKSAAGQKSTGKLLVVTRLLDAPPSLVFEAWSTPEHLKRWWALVAVTFEDQKGKTKLTMRQDYRDSVMPAGAFEGWTQSLERLAQALDPTRGSSTQDREIVLSRLLDAPRELVFKAWTDPKHIGHWWGPRGFTLTTHEMDVRRGGSWRFIMHGPDGRDYHNKIIYLEIAKPERLVYKHAGEKDTEDVRFHVTVTFAEHGGKTQLTMRSVFETAAERDRLVKEYGAIEGGKQTLGRLAEHLTKMA